MVRPSPSRSDWSQLLEQASDFNDELCRENCELHREVSVLRQRQLEREAVLAGTPGGGRPASRSVRAASLVPRVTSHIRRALGDFQVAGARELHTAIEEAVQQALAAARGEALASSEETAALVSEKVALKEFSVRQQERLLELELAKEKLSGMAAGHWAARITSAFQGTMTEPALPAAALHSWGRSVCSSRRSRREKSVKWWAGRAPSCGSPRTWRASRSQPCRLGRGSASLRWAAQGAGGLGWPRSHLAAWSWGLRRHLKVTTQSVGQLEVPMSQDMRRQPLLISQPMVQSVG